MRGAMRQYDNGDPETGISNGDLPNRPRKISMLVVKLPALESGGGPGPRWPAANEAES